MQSDEKIVKLNVGGTIFQTTKSTLMGCDGMLKRMMKTEIPVIKDESGAIFIDRDPTHFRLILNFLRDRRVVLPESIRELEEIKQEAQYYLLTDLVNICKEEDSENPLGQFQHIKSDADMIEALADQSKPILIIYHPKFDSSSSFRKREFDILNFANDHKPDLNIYFKSYTEKGNCGAWKWELYQNKKLFSMPIQSNLDSFLTSLENSRLLGISR